MACIPIIKTIHSPDVRNLSTWEAVKLDDVYILIELEIGPKDQKGADIFQVLVSTPEALRTKRNRSTKIIEDRGVLVVASFDWNAVREHLETTVAMCEGESWIDSTQKLQRFFHWEYEDYTSEVVT